MVQLVQNKLQIDVNVTQKPAFNTVHLIEKQHEELVQVLKKKKQLK